jgi:4-hydroxy-tetrahydrodipicolinate reductase
MTLRIAINGAAGRMGQALVIAAAESPDLAIAGACDRAGSPELGADIGALSGLAPIGVALTDSAADASRTAHVWIDFTTPAATLSGLDALPDSSVRAAVIGTTGLSDEEERQVTQHARRIAIVKAGNFSMGVNLLTALVEQAAQRLGPDWDIEIRETHHRRKADAPSGTALMIGSAAAQGRGAVLPDVRSAPYDGPSALRERGRIGFAVTRGGGVVGDHEAQFISDSEILTIGHRALDRSIFARGALHAARWAAGRAPGLYTMRDVLGV